MKPLSFSRPMVLARRAGRKTQTRRLLNPQPGPLGIHPQMARQMAETKCPYGKPGEQLWVREDFQVLHRIGTDASRRLAVRYQADELRADVTLTEHELALWTKRQFPYRKTPGRFMYQSLARDRPTLLAVRVERLQDITEEDAIAEGVEQHIEGKWWQGYRTDLGFYSHTTIPDDGSGQPPDWLVEPKPYRDLSHLNRSAKREFLTLWESIHGPGSAAANPYVWVLTLTPFTEAA